jgi:short-subunit dehydrogenase
MSKGLCVVVGAGSGVGLSVAKKFASEGFSIALVARRKEALDKYLSEMNDLGYSDAKSYVADAADFQSIENVFSEIHASQGNTDVLVYNAAVLKAGYPSKATPERLVDEFKVNVAGALASVRQVIPSMTEKKHGTILFTGGGLAIEPYPQYSSLAIGKAGIRSLAFSLAGELSPHNIHVATVTIHGIVKPKTKFDPDLIAQEFWNLHIQESGNFDREFTFK